MADNTQDWGFTALSHLAAERVSQVGESVVFTAIEQTAAEYSRQLNDILASFVEPTTDHLQRFYFAAAGTLQPLDDNGNPRVVRAGPYADVAFPIQGGGTAWGSNRVSRALMTVGEAQRYTQDALIKDADWVRRHVLAATLDPVAWTYSDPEYGDLTIQPLCLSANTTTYPKVGGSVATDQHYLGQAASIDDDNNPFDDIYDELIEHPGNRPPIVVYVPTNLKASIEDLTAFTEVGDPDLAYGTGTDLVPSPINRGMGDEVLGKCNRCWIIQWRALPDSYMIAHAVGAGAVLKMRQYPSASLQGFFVENHDQDGNLMAVRMIRYGGFGVVNRVAAVCYRIGSASYTAAPTGYDAPLAI